MLNKKIAISLLPLIFYSHAALALLNNTGVVYVPYKEQEMRRIENQFTSYKPLNARYMNDIEELIHQNDRLFIIEESYEKSSSLNILMFDSSDTSGYGCAFLTVDYAELQRQFCKLEKSEDPMCESLTLNLKKLLIRTSKGISLTKMGFQILLGELQSASAIDTTASIFPGGPLGLFFTHKVSFVFGLMKTQFIQQWVTEVRFKEDELFLTKTENFYSANSHAGIPANNAIYAKFPINNKINLRGPQ